MLRLIGFAKNLNSANTLKVQNCINSMGNFVHWMYWFSGFLDNLNIQNCVNSMGNGVLFMYGFCGFALNFNCTDMLNVQNWVISFGNCEH